MVTSTSKMAALLPMVMDMEPTPPNPNGPIILDGNRSSADDMDTAEAITIGTDMILIDDILAELGDTSDEMIDSAPTTTVESTPMDEDTSTTNNLVNLELVPGSQLTSMDTAINSPMTEILDDGLRGLFLDDAPIEINGADLLDILSSL